MVNYGQLAILQWRIILQSLLALDPIKLCDVWAMLGDKHELGVF